MVRLWINNIEKKEPTMDRLTELALEAIREAHLGLDSVWITEDRVVGRSTAHGKSVHVCWILERDTEWRFAQRIATLRLEVENLKQVIHTYNYLKGSTKCFGKFADCTCEFSLICKTATDVLKESEADHA
jgi:hypothetical protein